MITRRQAKAIRMGITIGRRELIKYELGVFVTKPKAMSKLEQKAYGHTFSNGFKKLCKHCRKPIHANPLNRWVHTERMLVRCRPYIMGLPLAPFAHPSMTLCGTECESRERL